MISYFPAVHGCTFPADTYAEKRCDLKLEKGKIYECDPKDARSRAKCAWKHRVEELKKKGTASR